MNNQFNDEQLRDRIDKQNAATVDMGETTQLVLCVSRFEQAWNKGTPPELTAFLPHDPALRRVALPRLIRLDLEYRLNRQETIEVETYFRRHQELRRDREAVLDLIAAEFELRLPREPNLTADHYLKRYPKLKADLAPRLQYVLSQCQSSSKAKAKPAKTVAQLVRQLNDHGFVDVDESKELDRLQRQFTDPQLFIAELVRCNRLTGFQAEAILNGRANELSLGDYVLLEPLGEGGMGTVYQARHKIMKRTVALKIIRKGRLPHATAVQRFQREIEAAAQLSHPNIVAADDAGRAKDSHYFVMEYVDGTDLGALLKKHGPLPIPLACECIRQTALGLQHAHEKNMVHRDVKPNNILLYESQRTSAFSDPKSATVKILDMGLARLRYDPLGRPAAALTQMGVFIGTLDYIAPEQIKDASCVDIRADIYSLGCTFYRLLTDVAPFPGGGVNDKLAAHIHTNPPDVRHVRPEIPTAIATIVRKMMEKQPEGRYQTPTEVADAIDRHCAPNRTPAPIAADAIAPAEETVAYEPQIGLGESEDDVSTAPQSDRTSKLRFLIGLTATAILLLTAVVIVALVMRGNKEPSPERPQKPAMAVAPFDVAKAKEHQRLWAEYLEQPKEFENSVGMTLVLIPPGTFLLGSPESEKHRHPSEGPQRKTTITRPFYLGVHEVTQDAYEKVMGDNPSHFHAGQRGGSKHPVELVSWEQCREFCRRLSLRPAERAAGRKYRLPTSAEWEHACRAGTTTAFYFGETIFPSDANITGGKGQTTAVGQYKPNPWGLFDMHGNVWEYCSDWFGADYYAKSPSIDPQGPPKGPWRVVRGGGFNYAASSARSAYRYPDNPTVYNNLGCRVVCEITLPAE